MADQPTREDFVKDFLEKEIALMPLDLEIKTRTLTFLENNRQAVSQMTNDEVYSRVRMYIVSITSECHRNAPDILKFKDLQAETKEIIARFETAFGAKYPFTKAAMKTNLIT